MAETIYETTIADYETVIGALPENTVDTPYTVRITEFDATRFGLRTAIRNANRYVNIIWAEGLKWNDNANSGFSGCIQLISIDTSIFLNVTSITNTGYMFDGCINLKTIDASVFTNITDMYYMFSGCTSLTSINTSGFVNVKNAKNAFSGCTSLTSIDTSPFINVQNAILMFSGCTSLTSIDISPFKNVTDAGGMFNALLFSAIEISSFDNPLNTIVCSELPNSVTDVYVTKKVNSSNEINTFKASTPSNIQELLWHFSIFTTIANYENTMLSFDVNTVNTPYDVEITDIENLTTSNLKTAIINAGKFVNITWAENAEWNGTDATEMFENCTPLINVDTTAFPNIINATRMFSGCINLHEINTIPFTNISIVSGMFVNCIRLITVNTNIFTNITNTYELFKGCTELSEIDTSPFVNVITAEEMFNGCTGLSEINTSPFTNVTNANSMFKGCSNITEIDTSPFDNVINVNSMFENCSGLSEIDTTPFSSVQSATNMFNGCSGLSEIDETNFAALVSATGMFDGTGKTHFDFTASPNLATLSIPDDTVSLNVNGTALTAIDLSNTANLEYLDVSNTNITSLNLIHCSSLPYCEWDTINEEKVLVKGWLAKNCTSLLTVKATETQVQDANLNLKNDTNALEGCTALQEVEVACNSRPSYSGNEVHYGKVKFENEVIFNNGLSLGEQALKDIFNIFVPVNKAKYIQLGGDPYPWEFYPFTKKTDWKNISSQYANEYFRVAGGEKPMGYFLTEDTEIVAGKTYYTRSGTDPNYTYTAVASPVVANIGTYYELSTNLTASTINNGDSDYQHITQAEGIPNIRGIMNAQSGLNGGCEGAFSRGGSTKNDSGTGGNHEGYVFTASSGERKMNGTYKNDVYGKSDHVTTYNSAIQIWRRIS